MPLLGAFADQDNVEQRHDAGGLTLAALEKFLQDMRFQPEWRIAANEEADYYDGNQLDAETINELQKLGLPPLVTNLVQPTIDLVLGMEARTRRGWKIDAEDPKGDTVAEALSARMHIANRLTRSDRAISDAYADQIKVGMGWVEVSKNRDPFGYPYRVRYLNRREIWWDWRSLEPDLSDARYLIRRKWYDTDYLKEWLPQFAKIIENATNQYASWDMTRFTENMLLHRSMPTDNDTTIEDMEWLDTFRSRACLYEVWYRVMTRGFVMRVPGTGQVIQFDRNNPRHRMAVEMGIAELESAVIPQLRVGLWVGPHRLTDQPNPNPFNGFPYVPFWGKREDRTGIPYGLIRSMKSPQDEVNRRRQKMLMLLSSKRVIADDDAVKNGDHETIMAEVSRPDAYIKLNPSRANKGAEAFRVETDLSLNQQQFEVMRDAVQRIQDAAGVYQESLGKGKTGQSGRAISQLVEQSTTSLGEINDNYEYARNQVGERVLAFEKQHMMNRTNIEIAVGGKRNRRVVVVNKVEHVNGEHLVTNNPMLTKMHVALEDVPATATFRQEQIAQLSELAKGLPPQLQAVLVPFIVQATDIPHKEEIEEQIRKALGMPPLQQDPANMTPEERQEAEQRAQEQQQQAQLQQANVQLELSEKQAKVMKLQAEVKKIEAGIQQDERNYQLEIAKLEQGKQSESTQHAISAMNAEIQARKVELLELQANLKHQKDMLDVIQNANKVTADQEFAAAEAGLKRDQFTHAVAQAAKLNANDMQTTPPAPAAPPQQQPPAAAKATKT